MKFRNISTGEVFNVSNLKMRDGRIFFQVRGKGCGTKFFNRNVCLVLDEHVSDGTYLKVADGWELAEERKERKPRAPKAPRSPKAESKEQESAFTLNTPPTEPSVEAVEVKSIPAEEAEAIASELNAGVDAEALRAELSAKYGTMGEDIFVYASRLAEIIRPEAKVSEEGLKKAAEEAAERVVEVKMTEWSERGRSFGTKTIEVVSPQGRHKVSGATAENFDIYCNLVQAGKPLYMYGPAGSGKSYTAKQIAEALGLDYYETSQAMFAHELKGYGDAAGKFVETAFYRAFANGGVFFLDEVDASAPEALVVLNNAIANKRFDFPVIGNIEAHENFRVIAAGNTRMTGATLEYTARQMQDTSFKNRFFFEVVTYSRDVMMEIAGGDEEIVNFGADLRRAARETGISQLFSYRQCADLATLQAACNNDDAHLLRGSVLQEKEVDDALNLYEHLENKRNRWAKAMKKCIEHMKTEEVW